MVLLVRIRVLWGGFPFLANVLHSFAAGLIGVLLFVLYDFLRHKLRHEHPVVSAPAKSRRATASAPPVPVYLRSRTDSLAGKQLGSCYLICEQSDTWPIQDLVTLLPEYTPPMWGVHATRGEEPSRLSSPLLGSYGRGQDRSAISTTKLFTSMRARQAVSLWCNASGSCGTVLSKRDMTHTQLP